MQKQSGRSRSSARWWMVRVRLALRLAARCLLDLGLVFAAGAGAGSLGCGFLAGGALELLALELVDGFGGEDLAGQGVPRQRGFTGL